MKGAKILSPLLPYTTKHCIIECWYRESMEACSCVKPIPRNFLANQSIPYCMTEGQVTCDENLPVKNLARRRRCISENDDDDGDDPSLP